MESDLRKTNHDNFVIVVRFSVDITMDKLGALRVLCGKIE